VYYDRAISIRSAAGEDRGTGDETLAAYYWKLAHARLGLRQVSDAVDAACGAIESWGSDGENRRSAVHGLQQVLAQVPGLDRYVDSLDAQVAEGGEENPVLRQALGWVYMQKRKFPKAVTQLQRAIVADPLNQRSHELLVKVYERSADSQGAVDAFYQWILYFPDEAALYEELARRLAKAGLAVESERVLTSMVDLREQDFEGHARLAGIRERQGRWSDALHHWQQVAHIRSTDPS
jgi:tetratricopeptide (TPR) repeat protein